jgi:hypothetical protein
VSYFKVNNIYNMVWTLFLQIQRLSATWHVLRQKFTDSAFNFEAKLRPTLKSMNECTNPQAPNTTIPHLLPFVLLQERTLDDILGNFTFRINTVKWTLVQQGGYVPQKWHVWWICIWWNYCCVELMGIWEHGCGKTKGGGENYTVMMLVYEGTV